jgi:DNA/RNA-binding protein KIN17
MGKHDAFSPKALANKMKAKGLQRLRWYCQMCEKQCRDENGFKCHLTSDGHMRMMQVFSENPKSFIDDFSKQFERGFMDIVRRKWRTKRVFANKVYQEYIADKEHVHMNGTRWESLAGFVMFLGKTGQCFVEETPKGWYIKYIERDPEVLARQEMIKQKERMDADDEMRNQKLIEKQLEFLATQGEGADGTGEVTSANEFKREDDSQKIQLALNVAKPKKVVAAVK